MKQLKIFIALSLVSIFSTVSAAEVLDAKQAIGMEQVKIGFLDPNIILDQSAIAKLYKPSIEAQTRQVETRINVIAAEFKQLEQNYKTEQGIASDAELQAMQQEMQQKEYEAQSLQQQHQQATANFGQSFSQQFGNVYLSAIELVVKEKQLDLVFDANSILYMNNKLDISQEVLVKFDELTVASYQQIKTQLESQKAN